MVTWGVTPPPLANGLASLSQTDDRVHPRCTRDQILNSDLGIRSVGGRNITSVAHGDVHDSIIVDSRGAAPFRRSNDDRIVNFQATVVLVGPKLMRFVRSENCEAIPAEVSRNHETAFWMPTPT